jgi:23S rRNA (cytosine1962-C5)-methyltransferase
MQASPFPVLRLKPKADARRIRHGHPWAWADDLVLDRRSRKIEAGALAVLEDAERVPLGVGVATVEARIGFRMLDRDAGADRRGLARRKLKAALRLRSALHDAPFYRLVHAEGDGLPGLIVDRFGDTLVMQPNAIWLEDRLETIVARCCGGGGLRNADQERHLARARGRRGWPRRWRFFGSRARGAARRADERRGLQGRCHGRAEDGPVLRPARPNHAFAARLARGARVLDVFSHVGGFALACLAQGAASALAVDASDAALALARGGAEASGVAERFETRAGDAFDTMAALAGEGAVFDLVICDPPAFAPSKQALQQGLRAYERVARLAADLVAPGGVVILCSCSHAADLGKFRGACLRGLGARGARSAADPHRVRGAGPSAAPGADRNGVSQGAGVPVDAVSRGAVWVLDACVLYPTVLREVLIGCAEAGLFVPAWSARSSGGMGAHGRAAGRGGGRRARARRDRAPRGAASPVADTGHDPAEEAALWLPDPADIHVLATARAAGADGIVTMNLRDFPRRELAPLGLAAVHPDPFLLDLMAGGAGGRWRASCAPSTARRSGCRAPCRCGT